MATLRLLALGAATLLTLAASGCAGSAAGSSEPAGGETTLTSDADGGVGLAAEALTCSWGSYICSRTGESFDYEPPGCGPDPTKPVALSRCRAACRGGTCRDTGWQSW